MRRPDHHCSASFRSGGVMVVQPYVPSYRVPFFDEVDRRLRADGSHLTVVHGKPHGGQADRGDADSGSWSYPIHDRQVSLLGHQLAYRPVLALARKSAVVVAELASSNIDTYALALIPKVRLMLWGHGKAYVTADSRLDARLEIALARRAERVFVYTNGGADYLRSKGYDPDRVTVLRNSTDTVSLRRLADAIDAAEVANYRQRWGLGTGPVAAFVGGYDASKNLPLLFAAAARVYAHRPDFRLLVAGAGPLQALVDDAAAQNEFIVSLPRAEARDLALLGRASSCMVIPGRVGLVAVDALALGLPVVTTTYAHHAPEAEYLTAGVKVETPEHADALAVALLALLDEPDRLAAAQQEAARLGGGLSVEAMAEAFCLPMLRGSRPPR